MSIAWRNARMVRAGWLVLFLTLGGCKNFGPVRDFASESKNLAATFRTMPAVTVDVCRTDQMLGQQVLHAGIPFVIQSVRMRADQVCAPQLASEAHILPFALLIEQYADALAALVDEKLPDYSVDLKTLQASASTLKDKDGQPVLSEARTQALVSLAEFLGRIATERLAKTEIRRLLDQQEGLQAATTALSWYATRVYLSQLATYNAHIDATAGGKLPALEKTEPLAARQMMLTLAKERQRVDALIKAADTFVAAAARLDSSRAEVRAILDRPSGKESLTQLRALAQEVHALRKQLHAIDS